MTFSRLVLPAPLRPTTPTLSPARRHSVSPCRRDRPATSTSRSRTSRALIAADLPGTGCCTWDGLLVGGHGVRGAGRRRSDRGGRPSSRPGSLPLGERSGNIPRPTRPALPWPVAWGCMDRSQAFVFDLDGTLVDSVYQHVLAWQNALDAAGIELSVWRIHRKVGMSGGLFANALLREIGREVTAEQAAELRRLHAESYASSGPRVRPLPGARELLAHLTAVGTPWAIATSGYRESAGPTIDLLGVPEGVPVITRDLVERAKPDPDLFLAAAEELAVGIEDCIVVGDSVWDLLAARRARALGVGVLSGGYGRGELESAGADRGDEGPADPPPPPGRGG